MKTQILNLIKEKPKHYSKMVKNDEELNSWILNNTLVKSANYAEMIYSAVNQESNKCKRGNTKKFNSFKYGYRFCGRANVCKCANESVSNSVSKAKQLYTQEENDKITAKRVKTTLKKHGVTNNGQINQALQTRADLYANKERVQEITQQVQGTKLKRYNNPTYNNPEQIKASFKLKAEEGFWIEKYDDKEIAVLNNKEELEVLYKQFSIIELAEKFNVHTQTVYRYLNKHKLRQPFKSAEENEIVGYLESLGITNIIRNSRKIIAPKEIDIYLPDYNIAIEYNGVYWHHEDIDHIDKEYHYNKYKSCQDLGIQLITIFSTFWHSKKDIVKSILRSKLGLNKQSVYARKCIVEEINATDSKQFQNLYHIQGHTRSKFKYGLKYNNELVALMTFSETKSRPGIGKTEPGYELIRYVSKSRVVGGASKLLAYFVNKHNPVQIISYSDNEWSNGNLYNRLGFSLDKKIIPSYWYIKHRVHKMYHRYNFAKHKLVEQGYDPNKTERQITKEMNLLKLWDCGKIRWVYK